MGEVIWSYRFTKALYILAWVPARKTNARVLGCRSVTHRCEVGQCGLWDRCCCCIASQVVSFNQTVALITQCGAWLLVSNEELLPFQPSVQSNESSLYSWLPQRYFTFTDPPKNSNRHIRSFVGLRYSTVVPLPAVEWYAVSFFLFAESITGTPNGCSKCSWVVSIIGPP